MDKRKLVLSLKLNIVKVKIIPILAIIDIRCYCNATAARIYHRNFPFDILLVISFTTITVDLEITLQMKYHYHRIMKLY